MRRFSLCCVLTMLALAGGPAVDAATGPTVIALGGPLGGDATALAGDLAVSAQWVDPGRHALGPVTVTARSAHGASRKLATFTAPKGSGANFYAVAVAASPTTWAVTVRFLNDPVDEEDPLNARGELVATGAVSGGPARTLASCTYKPVEDVDAVPVDVAVSGDDVAWSDSSCPGADGVRLVAAGATASTRVASAGGFVALTPKLVGYFTTDKSKQLVVDTVDRTTGVVTTLSAPGVSNFTLGDTGVTSVVVPDKPTCTDDCAMSLVRVKADGTLERPGLIHLPRTVPGPGNGGPVVFGGGRALAQRPKGNGVAAVDLATGTVSYAGGLGLDFDGAVPIAVDATHATFTAIDCHFDGQLRTESTVPSLPEKLATIPCPVTVLTHTAKLDHKHRTTLRVRCPRGCSESWDVRYRHQVVGSFEPYAKAGQTVKVPLAIDSDTHLPHGRTITISMVTSDNGDDNHPAAAHEKPVTVRLRVP